MRSVNATSDRERKIVCEEMQKTTSCRGDEEEF